MKALHVYESYLGQTHYCEGFQTKMKAHNKWYAFHQGNFKEPRLERASQLSFADTRNWKIVGRLFSTYDYTAFSILILGTLIPGQNCYTFERRLVVCQIKLERFLNLFLCIPYSLTVDYTKSKCTTIKNGIDFCPQLQIKWI